MTLNQQIDEFERKIVILKSQLSNVEIKLEEEVQSLIEDSEKLIQSLRMEIVGSFEIECPACDTTFEIDV